MKKLLLAVTIMSFLFVGCEKEENDYITYHDVIGEGYVFAYDSLGNVLHPVVDGIEVRTSYEPTVSFTNPNTYEIGTYVTDKTGKYQIRFIKRVYKANASKYEIYIFAEKKLEIDVADIEKAKNNILLLDTIKILK